MKTIISPKAGKQLLRFPANQGLKITKKLHELDHNPFAGKPMTGKLKGKYSLRAWPYRIIYQIFKDQGFLLVDTIEHRQGVYK